MSAVETLKAVHAAGIHVVVDGSALVIEADNTNDQRSWPRWLPPELTPGVQAHGE